MHWREVVDKQQLDAARSLFSFRADQPPAREPSLGEYDGPLLADGRRPLSLADLVALSVERGIARDFPELIEACRAVVAAAEEAPRGVRRSPVPLLR